MEQCIEVNMNVVMIKILQGSVITQTVLDGVTLSSGYKFPIVSTCARNYKNWLRVDTQSYCNEQMLQFFWLTWYLI